MDRLKTQANKLWQILSNPATAQTYQQTLVVTWGILKEAGQLLWLVLCLGLVAGEWFWKKSYQAGQDTRTWITNLQTAAQSTDKSSSTDVLSETGKSLLAVGQAGITGVLNAAKGQLGIKVEPKPQPPRPQRERVLQSPGITTPPHPVRPPTEPPTAAAPVTPPLAVTTEPEAGAEPEIVVLPPAESEE